MLSRDNCERDRDPETLASPPFILLNHIFHSQTQIAEDVARMLLNFLRALCGFPKYEQRQAEKNSTKHEK